MSLREAFERNLSHGAARRAAHERSVMHHAATADIDAMMVEHETRCDQVRAERRDVTAGQHVIVRRDIGYWKIHWHRCRLSIGYLETKCACLQAYTIESARAFLSDPAPPQSPVLEAQPGAAPPDWSGRRLLPLERLSRVHRRRSSLGPRGVKRLRGDPTKLRI